MNNARSAILARLTQVARPLIDSQGRDYLSRYDWTLRL